MLEVVLKAETGELESFAVFGVRTDAVTIFSFNNCPDDIADLCLSGEPEFVYCVPYDMQIFKPKKPQQVTQLLEGCFCFV